MAYLEIQTQNDMAASLIANGESQVSSTYLSNALTEVRTRLRECVACKQQSPSPTKLESHKLSEPSFYPAPPGVGDGTKTFASEPMEFYSTPFVFTDLSSDSSSDEEELDLNGPHSIKRCGIACLFNLGLTCHLAWARREQPHNSNLLLQKALEFYYKAYEAISQTYQNKATKQLCLDPQDSMALVVMALCTNIWHCHHESCSGLQQAQLWHGNLRRVLSFAAEEHKYDESYHFFYTFAMFKDKLITARAA